ncbi:hypothetical protein AAFF_G00145050 [Aldrovandia affinis]|uniref:Uncharacterized protein n=1 Tax=Aldrovandia affinis TaxID=143900 RepID=A0AAD7T0S5_9TELE|nr:hypothetical protein AAFF_G00145050 [Aldrovandia affinis]
MRSDFHRCMFHQPGAVYTLHDFSEWLQYECQDFDGQTSDKGQKEKHQQKFEGRASIYKFFNARTIKEAHKEESCLVTATEVLYLDRLIDCSRVLLKVVRVLLHHANCTVDTYAILDDGSERTMLLPAVARKLGLQGTPEDLALRL